MSDPHAELGEPESIAVADRSAEPMPPKLTWPKRILRELRSWLWTLALVWLVWMAVQSLRGGVVLPTQAPDFAAVTLDGKPIQLSQFRGKAVVLYFFASWCPACKVTSPSIDRFAASHPEVVVVGIAAEDAQDAKIFLAEQPRTFPVVAETPAMDAAYRVRALPTTVVVDAGGQVAWRRQGVVLPFELGWHLP